MIADLLYIACYVLIDITVCTLGYTIGFGKRFIPNPIKWFLVSISIILFHIFIFFTCGKEASDSLTMFSTFLIPLFLQKPFSIKNILIYPFIMIGASEISISSTFWFAAISGLSYDIIVNDYVYSLICQSSTLIILLIAMVIKKITNTHDEIILSKVHYIIIYLYSFSIFFLLAPAQSLAHETDTFNSFFIGITSSLASVLLLILLFWLIYASHREQKLKTQQMLTKQQMNLQKDYYNELINRDTAIRKFRHDMKAQLLVLRDFCISGSLDSAAEHIESMIDKSSLFERSSITGNNEVDAILSAAQAQAMEKDIIFEAKGMIPADVDIATYDLCSLVYNPLKNAIEACEKIPDSKQRYISFKASVYNKQLFIQVINSMSEDMIISDGELRTSKDDKLNHGYGLRIVSEIVKKYKGILEMKCEEGMFSLEISI